MTYVLAFVTTSDNYMLMRNPSTAGEGEHPRKLFASLHICVRVDSASSNENSKQVSLS